MPSGRERSSSVYLAGGAQTCLSGGQPDVGPGLQPRGHSADDRTALSGAPEAEVQGNYGLILDHGHPCIVSVAIAR
jgi:hypothetical protein